MRIKDTSAKNKVNSQRELINTYVVKFFCYEFLGQEHLHNSKSLARNVRAAHRFAMSVSRETQVAFVSRI
jgi:hypothetical protein